MGQSVLSGALNHGGLHIRLPIGDVVAHRVVEEHGLLRDLRHLAAQRCQREVANILFVNEDAARSDIEEARNQIHQRRFPGSARAHQRQQFASANLQVHVVQNLMFAFLSRVRETDVFKFHRLREPLERGCVVPLLHVVLGIEESEDGRRGAHGLLKAVVEVGKLPHRIVELEEHEDECAEHPQGHVTMENFIAPDEQEHGDGDGGETIHQRRTDCLNAHAAQVGAKLPCRFCETR